MEDELHVTPDDTVYLLGDLVSKGPDSIGVLHYVNELSSQGVSITILRGNHEEAILQAQSVGKGKLKAMLERTKNTALLDAETGKRLDPRWEEMFVDSVYVVPLPEAILVHGGIDFSADDPYADGYALVNARETIYDRTAAEDRPIIHGHTRAALSTIIENLVSGASVLPLDNGAVGASSSKPFKVSEYGNLCCLDLDRWTLHVQPNRDVTDSDTVHRGFSFRVRVSS